MGKKTETWIWYLLEICSNVIHVGVSQTLCNIFYWIFNEVFLLLRLYQQLTKNYGRDGHGSGTKIIQLHLIFVFYGTGRTFHHSLRHRFIHNHGVKQIRECTKIFQYIYHMIMEFLRFTSIWIQFQVISFSSHDFHYILEYCTCTICDW